MVKFYIEKIKSSTINQNTRKAWTVEDVPKLWKENVQKALQD